MLEPELIYWDASVFISYINNEPHRVNVLDAILEEIEKKNNRKIVTSVISKVEVIWTGHEKLKRLLIPEEENSIDAIWNNNNIVEMIEFNDEVALFARRLMRDAMVKGWKLKTNDAIHVASAMWVNATELHTYDMVHFKRLSEFVDFNICEPFTIQPKLI